MYKIFFGLKDNPFNVTPDPRFLYLTPHTQEALACLTYCVQARKGFVLLSGEVGTGKTTMLNKLLEWLRQEQIATAFVFNPRLNPYQFLFYTMTDFGITCETRQKNELLVQLNQWLLERYRAKSTAVLIVDEAQDLTAELLEEIRLLTNLETSTEKLLQIVLSGQQELEMKLKQPQFRQIWQRITLRTHTYPLTLDETREYIATRLRIAGSDGRQIFAPDSIEVIHKYTQGIPRVINVVCEDALIAAYADQKATVPKQTVEWVARDLELDRIPPTAPLVYHSSEDDIRLGSYPGAPVRREAQPSITSRGLGEKVNGHKVDRLPAASLPLPVAQPAPGQPVIRPQAEGPAARAIEGREMRLSAPPSAKTTGISGVASTPRLAEGVSASAMTAPVTPSSPSRAEDDDIVELLRPGETVLSRPATRPLIVPKPSVATPREGEGPSLQRLLFLLILISCLGAAGVYFYVHKQAPPGNGTETAAAPNPQDESGGATSTTAAPSAGGSNSSDGSSPQISREGSAETVSNLKNKAAAGSSRPKPQYTAGGPQRMYSRAAHRTEIGAPSPEEVGQLLVAADVAGARISVDGRTDPGWVTPHTFGDLPTGSHQIVISKEGLGEKLVRLTVRSGQTTSFTARLLPPGGEINIVTNPPGLEVSIDGRPFVTSPVQSVVAVGTHSYRIKLPGSRVYEGNFEMKDGSIITRKVDFIGGQWLAPNEMQ